MTDFCEQETNPIINAESYEQALQQLQSTKSFIARYADEEAVEQSMQRDRLSIEKMISESRASCLTYKPNCPPETGLSRGRKRSNSDVGTSTSPDVSESVKHVAECLNNDCDLSTEETQKEIDRVRNGKLLMAIQGLRSVEHSPGTEDNSRGLTVQSPKSKKNIDQLEFNGITFQRGRCYYYQVGVASFKQTVIIGIVGFLSSTKAQCVLVAPFEETFLGVKQSGEAYSLTLQPAPFVQVRETIDPLSLADFGNACMDPLSIPDLIYEPQVPGSWFSFGYIWENKKTRRGKRDSMRVMELFAGCGGMSQGFKREGFNIVKAVEHDKNAIETYAANNACAPIIQEDVPEFIRKYRENKDYREQLGRIDCVHLSAPCQGFSSANRNGGKHDKENNNLSLTAIDAAVAISPNVITFENVVGMWRKQHIHYLKEILAGLMKAGYQVRCCRLKACDYGDPQSRPRLFIFAAKNSVHLPSPPLKTHGEGPNQVPFVTVRDALHGQEEENDEQEPNVMPPHNGRVRLIANAQAPTVMASGVPPIHFSHDRSITVSEAAALQSFPPDYTFFGTKQDQYRQIGNAVPGQLAGAVARSVRLSLEYHYEE